MRRDKGAGAGKAAMFGCLVVILIGAGVAAALWVIFVWDVNQG
ncbi:hypothetical protein [Brevundimonas sp. UBA7534]|nr:hypothetical protein [Brevundimonas sp. UBA7534]